MGYSLGGITFNNSCPYRGRKDLSLADALERKPLKYCSSSGLPAVVADQTWICTISPGKECSAAICGLEIYPFEDSDVEGSQRMNQDN